MLADPGRRAILDAAMAPHDVRIGDDIGGRFTGTGAVMGFRARLEVGELGIRSTVPGEGAIGHGWEALVDRLAGPRLGMTLGSGSTPERGVML